MSLKNEKTIPLKEIVSEYHSKLFLVKNLFWDRIKYAIQFSNINDDQKILDVGCGAGYLLEKIREENERCKLIGIDFNENINQLLIPGCEIIMEDATKLSFRDNSFDIVFALDTLEHIKNVDIAIKEIKRVLKSNGEFIISGPMENWFYKFCRFLIKGTFSAVKGPGTGVHYHTIDSLDKEIVENSFIKEKSVNLPKFFPLVLERVIKYCNKK